MRATADLRRRILNRTAKIVVVGQGYVGLSLACAAADAGFCVTGVDVDPDRIVELADGRTTVAGVDEGAMQRAFASELIRFSTSAEAVADSHLIFVCVPTPLSDGTPDLTYIQRACRDVAAHLTPGSIVTLESTTYPGTTDELVRPLLETSGLLAGKDFLLAFSPERIDPGNDEYAFRQVPRIVGGMNPESTGVAVLFYEQLVDKVMAVSSCRAAELAKLLENKFRHVNIALVNELAMVCHEVDIDVWEVIAAAATKPFGFMAFYPGPGVGGHCIPLDPGYLAWQVRRDVGHQFRVLEEAEDINAQMPAWVTDRIAEALNDRGKAVKDAKILILGVAYKPDVADARESPAVKVMNALHRRGALLAFHDPYIEDIALNGKTLLRTNLTNTAVAQADLVAVLTPHSAYDLEWVCDHAKLVFDTRNAYNGTRRANVIKL